MKKLLLGITILLLASCGKKEYQCDCFYRTFYNGVGNSGNEITVIEADSDEEADAKCQERENRQSANASYWCGVIK